MPRLFSYQRYPFTANFWRDESPDEIGGLTFVRPLTLSVVQDEYGRVLCTFRTTENDLKPGDQLHELANPDGIELYPNGVWVLDTYEPELNVYSQLEGYRGRATLTFESSGNTE